MGKQNIFRFRQFSISHARSSMKVGTDAILLGSWVDVSITNTILDIGTGCGIIALMLAQRSMAKIDAIDIDKDSIDEAAINFNNSPWNNRLQAIHSSLQDFRGNTNTKYDLIVSNPPYFINSLLPATEKLKLAKHNLTLSYEELIHPTEKLLNHYGRLAVILPNKSAEPFIQIAKQANLFLSRQLTIYPTPEKAAKRMILVFGYTKIDEVNTSGLILRHENGEYTKEYKKLTGDFHPELLKNNTLSTGI
jgi:tRNA1Val (adenine37-N6)-methyltransferase